MIPPLVSTSWLAKQIGSADLDILDASFFLPADQRDNRAEFEAAHIPGAQLFDLSEICDQTSSLPNMLPSPEDFAAKVAALGVSHTHRIVIYDNSPHHSSARAWWMFQVFGAHQVAILNGGFAEWEAEELPTESGFVEATLAEFTPSFDAALVRNLDQMLANVNGGSEQVIDARSEGRFLGKMQEPRPSVQPGHIPGSYNLPHEQMFAEDHRWKDAEGLKAVFENLGINLDKPIAATCGSGVTATVLAFAATLIGAKTVSVYDGSWSEWGSIPSTPKSRLG